MIDDALLHIMELAASRGHKYVKGETALDQIHDKMAELGILLLNAAQRLPGLDEQNLKEELIDVQQKMDDLRKAIFTNKIKVR